MEEERQWYVIHTYSGYENKVKANLERKIQSMGMQTEIFQVLVPMEDEVEIKDGKRKVTKKKIFPGYVLVEMIVNDRTWYVVRNTPGVTGSDEAFVQWNTGEFPGVTFVLGHTTPDNLGTMNNWAQMYKIIRSILTAGEFDQYWGE